MCVQKMDACKVSYQQSRLYKKEDCISSLFAVFFMALSTLIDGHEGVINSIDLFWLDGCKFKIKMDGIKGLRTNVGFSFDKITEL